MVDALGYLNDKAKPFIESLAHEAGAPVFIPCDAAKSGQLEACDVGRTALMLASNYACAITWETLYVDAGIHIEGMVFH